MQVATSDSHTLTLRSVSRELSGVFRCEVSEDAPTFHTDIKESRMQVVELPMDEPNLHIDKKEVSNTDGFKAVCTVGKSYPSANLTWTMNGKKVILAGYAAIDDEKTLFSLSCSFFFVLSFFLIPICCLDNTRCKMMLLFRSTLSLCESGLSTGLILFIWISA